MTNNHLRKIKVCVLSLKFSPVVFAIYIVVSVKGGLPPRVFLF